jgi:glycosyltransferase involved in cell wall biosynthesis
MSYTGARRIFFDITTSMRWAGPPVGIVRVEQQLGLWALQNLSNVKFVFFDPSQMAYRELKFGTIQAFLAGHATLQALGLPDPTQARRRKTDRAPPALRPVVLWLGQPRRMLLGRLEAIRLGAASPRARRLAGWLQKPLMSRKYRKIMFSSDGARRPFLPYQMALSTPINLFPGDMLICAGAGWSNTNIQTIRNLKSHIGFYFVLLCHDLIPLLFPQFYPEHDVQAFRSYMHEALAAADLIAVTTKRSEQDCLKYLSQHKIPVSEIAVTPLGFDGGGSDLRIASLPDDLSPGRFVLFVSTIEPRKGHRLLYTVWRRLTLEGVIRSKGFKLVFVGRPGWMVADLLQLIRSDPAVRDEIIVMDGVDDSLLNAMYRGTAFCVYPSKYEGYGLPICEAFYHGKAVLASNGGALPELVQNLSPCLDPEDEEAWYSLLKEWIEHPEVRVPFEQAIKSKFRHLTWSEAAANFFLTCEKGFDRH